MYDITASIVLYKTPLDQLIGIIDCLKGTMLRLKLYLVDNDGSIDYTPMLKMDKIAYIKTGQNLGYGAGHNVAIREAIHESLYHVVLNPDIRFQRGVLEEIIKFMDYNPTVGQLMPRVVYPDGELQHLCKRLPTPLDLFIRRFVPIKRICETIDFHLELRSFSYDQIVSAPYLSGCFMFFRTAALMKAGFFDERFFMYPEDIDLTRRIHRHYKTVFYPYVTIIHDHAKESYKSLKMLKIHTLNLIRYFNKWGWIIDRERAEFNRQVLKECLNPTQDYALVNH